jgi:hypothetical protein
MQGDSLKMNSTEVSMDPKGHVLDRNNVLRASFRNVCGGVCGLHADGRGGCVERCRTRSGGAGAPCQVVGSTPEPEPHRDIVIHPLRETPRVHYEDSPCPAA